MVAPFEVDPGWMDQFNRIVIEVAARSNDGVQQAAYWLAEQHPRDALMAAYAIEYAGDGQWQPDQDTEHRNTTYRDLSGDILRHLIPLLGIRVLDHGIPQPLTPPHEDGDEDDPNFPYEAYSTAMDTLNSRVWWLTRMHIALSQGVPWRDAHTRATQDNPWTADQNPDWVVIQPEVWEL